MTDGGNDPQSNQNSDAPFQTGAPDNEAQFIVALECTIAAPSYTPSLPNPNLPQLTDTHILAHAVRR